MGQAMARTETPEEREYARYLTEIDVRNRKVADLQTDLQLLQEKLGQFNAEYHTRVGTLFIELDKIELSIREYEYRIDRLQSDPTLNPEVLEREARDRFTDQREDVFRDEEETRRHRQAYHDDLHRTELDEHSELRLKTLFRDLAKRFHPDLARTDAERQQREAIMKRVNAAFHERNIKGLESISAETAFEDAAFEARPIGEKLIWAIREVSRLDDLIASMGEEHQALIESDLARLWQRREDGDQVIERLERAATLDVEEALQRLQEAKDRFQSSANLHHS